MNTIDIRAGNDVNQVSGAFPSQSFLVTLNGQDCSITIFTRDDFMYMSLSYDDPQGNPRSVYESKRITAFVPWGANGTEGFIGDFLITTNDYTQLEFLYYFTPGEILSGIRNAVTGTT